MKRTHIRGILLFAIILLLVVLILGWRFLMIPSGDSASVKISSLQHFFVGLYLDLREGDVESPVSSDVTSVLFTVHPGETASTIAARLKEAGLIADADLFHLLVEYRGVDALLEAGDYRLSPSMSMEEIVEVLQHGRPYEVAVTIPEGWRAEEIAQLLNQRQLVDAREFLTLVREGQFDYAFLEARPPGVSLEGYLFPDTYSVIPGTAARDFIELMLANLDRRFDAGMREKAQQRGMTIHQVLTLASLVEREAVIPEERPVIASVYINRLQAGWLLEADSTAQYALGYQEEEGTWWKTPISLEEMNEIESPYNTYLHPGLPPGPICNPGLASIQAVLEPAQTSYMFYYHKGDGSHAFAVTYEEHLENQRLYGGQ